MCISLIASVLTVLASFACAPPPERSTTVKSDDVKRITTPQHLNDRGAVK